MSFDEFLRATGDQRFADLVKKRDWNGLRVFESHLVSALKDYFVVGGMPEAVSAFAAGRDYLAARTVQKRILRDYDNDFAKHAPVEIVPKLRSLWDSVPAQLAKGNKRFVFSEVTPGARTRDLAVPLWWLFDAGLLFKVKRVSRPEKPLSAYEDGAFKLFFLDIGLLGAKAGLDIRTILEGDRVFREFKGALAEQFVHQEMRGLVDAQYYWTQRDAELDFLIDDGADILPIEVKAERNLQAKSLRLFCERFKMGAAVRFSMHGYTEGAYPFGTRLIDCPLFAARSLLASRSCV